MSRFSALTSARLPDEKPPRLTLWPLVAATFFMVSGGAYGTEDIVRGAGYGFAILVLLLTPLLWSMPVALMVGELGAALPKEGGYYAWVRRALGDVWGFQEAWLSLTASIFDMAIYPTLFVLYLVRLFPWFGIGRRGLLAGIAVVAVCAVLNIAGINLVAKTSVWLFFLLSAPFAAIVLLAPFYHGALVQAEVAAGPQIGVAGGLLVAMWNYMGWDNASTIAAAVEHPQRTYPRAMLASVSIVCLGYVLPVVAVWLTGMPAGNFATGAWADVAGLLGGPWLRALMVAGAMLSACGMFNALVMSYSRLPLAMAEDGMLPRIFARRHPRTQAPWVSIAALAAAWALCLDLGFERLITLDILLYGASLILEFVALVGLRITAPELARPFTVPGGLRGALIIGICPVALLGFGLAQSRGEEILGIPALLFGAAIVGLGFLLYGVLIRLRKIKTQNSTFKTS